MNWTDIYISPLLPVWPVAILLVIAAGLILFPLLHGGSRGIIPRLLFLGALCIALLNPQLVRRDQEPIDDEILLLVDNSPSQNLDVRPDHRRAALESIEAAAAQWPNARLRKVYTGSGSGGEEETRLYGPLAAALADIPSERLGGVVLVTDGLIHDDPADIGLLPPDAPIHTVITGSRHAADRRVVLERNPEFAVVERSVGLVAKVVDTNVAPQRESARLIARHDGETVFDQDVPINTPWPILISPDRAGPMTIELETPPLDTESYTENNRAILQLDAVRDRLRVLMVSGEPHPGERVWRSVLRSDPAIDLIHFTILRLPTSFDLTTTQELALIQFPVQELFENQLQNFDLVIFDRYRLMGVLPMFYLKLLADYVDMGGALLLASGPEFASPFNLFGTPLSQVLPTAPTGRMIETPFVPEVTATGRRHPVTAGLAMAGEGANWGPWFRLVEGVATGGQTLLTGPESKPALVLARMGEGRVAQLLSDQIWMWSRGLRGGGPHPELLRRTVHWLVREPDLEEESLQATGNGMELMIKRRSLSSEGGLVRLRGPDGEITSVELEGQGGGLSSASVEVETPGIYRISDGIREVLAGAGPLNSAETREYVPTADRIADFVSATGGGVFWAEDGMPRLRRVSAGSRSFGAGWMGLERREAARTLRLRQIPLIPESVALLILVLLSLLMWWRESR